MFAYFINFLFYISITRIFRKILRKYHYFLFMLFFYIRTSDKIKEQQC